MIIVLKPGASEGDIAAIKDTINAQGLKTQLSQGETNAVIGVIGDKSRLTSCNIEMYSGVERIIPVSESYKLANKKFHPEKTKVRVGDVEIGGDSLVIMAGPCAVETKEMLLETAVAVKAAGAVVLRGGVYKPRTSPYAFQGLEEEGLRYMRDAADKTGLKIICEVTSDRAVDISRDYIDIIQIGARNMQNFELLKHAGKTNLPILLKRGPSATIDEWLNAAEYILSEGNESVILCERGIRTYETATRNTLDLSAIPVVKEKSHLPIIVDPSHATGHHQYVGSMAKAAVAAGCDGLIIEVHPNPAQALSDGPQSLNFDNFALLTKELAPLAALCGKKF